MFEKSVTTWESLGGPPSSVSFDRHLDGSVGDTRHQKAYPPAQISFKIRGKHYPECLSLTSNRNLRSDKSDHVSCGADEERQRGSSRDWIQQLTRLHRGQQAPGLGRCSGAEALQAGRVVGDREGLGRDAPPGATCSDSEAKTEPQPGASPNHCSSRSPQSSAGHGDGQGDFDAALSCWAWFPWSSGLGFNAELEPSDASTPSPTSTTAGSESV